MKPEAEQHCVTLTNSEGPPAIDQDNGTGLGLAIVHRVALDHGGSVTLESAPGRTVFGVVVPDQMA